MNSTQPVPANPEAKFAAWQKEIESRLRAMETARQAFHVPVPVWLVGTTYETEDVNFLPGWNMGVAYVPFLGVRVFGTVLVEGGTGPTVAEVMLVSSDGVTENFSDAIQMTLGPDTTDTYEFNWLHLLPVGFDNDATLQLASRRVSGDGVVHTYAPRAVFAAQDEIVATAEGV